MRDPVHGQSLSPLAQSAGYVFDPATGNSVTVSLPGNQVRHVRLTFTGNTGWPAGQLSGLKLHT